MFVGCINYLDNIYYFILSLKSNWISPYYTSVLGFWIWNLEFYSNSCWYVSLLFNLYFSLTVPSNIPLLICGEGRKQRDIKEKVLLVGTSVHCCSAGGRRASESWSFLGSQGICEVRIQTECWQQVPKMEKEHCASFTFSIFTCPRDLRTRTQGLRPGWTGLVQRSLLRVKAFIWTC